MSFYKQIMPAPDGLRVVYQDGAGYEVESSRVLALALGENGDLLPIMLEDGCLREPKCTGLRDSWSLSFQ